MFQFIESIKLNDGILYHLDWHQKRMNETFETIYPNAVRYDLSNILQQIKFPPHGLYKLRVLYHAFGYDVQLVPYQPRNIQSIAMIEANFEYPRKALDRSQFQQALQNSGADEVVFFQKGYITDSSYANVVFWDGKYWVTPHTYLLNGTCRQRLIYDHKIKVQPVRVEDIYLFQKIGFINALNDLGEQTLNLNIL